MCKFQRECCISSVSAGIATWLYITFSFNFIHCKTTASAVVSVLTIQTQPYESILNFFSFLYSVARSIPSLAAESSLFPLFSARLRLM